MKNAPNVEGKDALIVYYKQLITVQEKPMSNELTVKQKQEIGQGFSEEQRELLRNTICKGCDNNQMQLFMYVCKKTGLDPFMKQIYAVVRKDHKASKEENRDVREMTIQTSINGIRLIADRTGNYVPGREPTFQYDKDGRIISATAYAKKRTEDGQWHEVSASAFYSEFVQKFQDYNTKQQVPTKFWLDMPHNQLSKCAEALCLRKAFPADCCGIYTEDEMAQADNVVVVQPESSNALKLEEKIVEMISQDQSVVFNEEFSKCSPDYKKKILSAFGKKLYSPERFPAEMFEKALVGAKTNAADYQLEMKQKEEDLRKAQDGE
jgi:phage recombination protein Bet